MAELLIINCTLFLLFIYFSFFLYLFLYMHLSMSFLYVQIFLCFYFTFFMRVNPCKSLVIKELHGAGGPRVVTR